MESWLMVGTMEFYDFPLSSFIVSSSQLTNSLHHFSEGLGINHQPGLNGKVVGELFNNYKGFAVVIGLLLVFILVFGIFLYFHPSIQNG